MVQPAVTEDGHRAPRLKFGQPRVMALLLALAMFHHLIDGFRSPAADGGSVRRDAGRVHSAPDDPLLALAPAAGFDLPST